MIDVVYFGSPEFAVPSLEALADDPRFRVQLVVTQPDRPTGRGRKLAAPAVKEAATQLQLPVWQPETLRSPDALEHLRQIGTDLFVVVAYGEIFRRQALAIPQHGALNVHPSLLPRYRGSSPIQASILNGDPETGVSIIRMVPKLDAGPIVAQRIVPLSGGETAGELDTALAGVAARMLPDACVDWCAGVLEATEQNGDLASYTRQLRKDDGRIDWRDPADRIERRVRAMAPWPGAWTRFDEQRLGIERAVASGMGSAADPGTVQMAGRAVVVQCGDGSLELRTVRPQGRGSMAAADWFRGVQRGDVVRFELPGFETSAP